jgi:hypothetical protein
MAAFAQVQLIDMISAFSDKIFDIKRHTLGSQINSEVVIDSIGGNTPALCGFAECIIYAETGYQGNFPKIIIH